MKVAIMQPYLFPYIGYFQLIYAVDTFVFLDDVNYINKGYINRNSILVQGQKSPFTIKLVKASQNRKINEIKVMQDKNNIPKFLATLKQNYKKSPFFFPVFAMVEKVMQSEYTTIDQLARHGVKAINAYLHIDTKIVDSSANYGNTALKGQDRILDICKREGADAYYNPIGGIELYSRDQFIQQGMQLHFLQTDEVIYSQFGAEFVPNLSILDVLFFNEPDIIQRMLEEYTLV